MSNVSEEFVLINLDLQLFADGDDDDVLLDAEIAGILEGLGTDEDADGFGGYSSDDFGDDVDDDDEGQPNVKKRVSDAVRKRLAKQKAGQQKFEDNFKELFGVSPQEAYSMGMQNAMVQVSGGGAAPQGTEQPQGSGDPRLDYVLNYVEERKTRDVLEAEAREFAAAFPGVSFEQVPEEVKLRRARGGVSLAEAYSIYLGTNLKTVAAQARARGTKDALTSVSKGRAVRTEGPDYGASSFGDAEDFFAPEDQDLAKDAFGMSPKEMAKYRRIARASE